jgi:TonB family protein
MAVAGRLPLIPAELGTLRGGPLFTLLPSPPSRWKSLLTGWSVQAVSLVCLVAVCAQFHERLISESRYRVTRLVEYAPVVLHEEAVIPAVVARTKPRPESKPVNKPMVENQTPVAAFVVTPQVRTVVERKVSEPEAMAPAPKLDNKMPVIPAAAMSQVVAVGTFSYESPVTAPVAKLAAVTQAGVFGGSGAGNGSGHGSGMGAGSPNVVMSSGFGNGAIDTLSGANGHAKAGGKPPGNGTNAPVEITFKPKPDYTDEGRKQKVNGEVRLEVVFKSDGRVHVLRVLQGLGHGLDEEAVKAAEQIKFKPALHEGQPVDSMALVHIIFELIS